MELATPPVDKVNVTGVDANAYGPPSCVALVDAENSLANNPSFAGIKLDS